MEESAGCHEGCPGCGYCCQCRPVRPEADRKHYPSVGLNPSTAYDTGRGSRSVEPGADLDIESPVRMAVHGFSPRDGGCGRQRLCRILEFLCAYSRVRALLYGKWRADQRG